MVSATDAIVVQLVKLVSAGTTIAAAASRCGLTKSAAYRRIVAYERIRTIDRRRHEFTTPAERRRILRLIDANHSRREVAEICGRSVSTVQAVVNDARDAFAGETRSRTLRTPRRCPVCGNLVRTWPCIACSMTCPAERHD